MTTIKFNIYAHEQHDEEPEENALEVLEDGLDGDIPLDELENFFESNPLYEVKFEVEYNTKTHKFNIVSADLGNNKLIKVIS